MIKIFMLNAASLITLITCQATDLTEFSPRDSIRVTIKDYNKIRINNTRLHEKMAQASLASELPDPLKRALKKFKKSEFSALELAEVLITEVINPDCVVTEFATFKGGMVSGKMYRATYLDASESSPQSKEVYIKYLRTKPILVSEGRIYAEQANLQKIATLPQLESIKEYLDVVLPVAIFEYTYNKKDKVFSLLPGAAGQSLSDLVKTDIDLANSAFTDLGTAYGKMHTQHRLFNGIGSPLSRRDFINTKVFSHNDLHGDNVFWDPETRKVALIDVETMANSIDDNANPTSPICYDFLYLLVMSEKKFGSAMSDNNWQPFKNLFKAYTDEYAPEEREGIYEYLHRSLYNAKKTKFKDIFQHFTFTKRFSSNIINGTKVLARYIEDLGDQASEESAEAQARASLFKEAVEGRYLKKKRVARLEFIEQAESDKPTYQPSFKRVSIHNLPPVEVQQLQPLGLNQGHVSNIAAKFQQMIIESEQFKANPRLNKTVPLNNF